MDPTPSWLGRPYGTVERWLTGRLLARRYDLPPDFLGTFEPGWVGVHDQDWWPQGSNRTPYVPSNWGILKRILRPGDVSSEDVFIDFGCGTGRVLLEAASRYPFRRVVGVDLVPQLTALATEALARNRGRLRCSDTEVVTCDVQDYEVPDDVSVAYFYEPFRGPISSAVIAKLIASVDRTPRRLRVVYNGDERVSGLAGNHRARLVRHGRRRLRRWRPAPYLRLYEIEPAR
jgi:SAM-dependent methyltransferase